MQGSLFEDDSSINAQKESAARFRDLNDLYEQSKDCTKCRLAETRNNFVFGEGNPKAQIVVIGEAPGAEEDAQGRPFVGRSGKLLDKILEAIGFSREDVFICNIIKCRPPENRNPNLDEIQSCMPWLKIQLQLIKPKILLLLGRVAANTVLDNKQSMANLRGRILRWNGYDVIVTYHPAALLRNPNWKRHCWEDVKMLRSHYDNMC
ncbi:MULTISPECIES: uracil-DNA glycosylase [unclassified Prosthecochloris]|uniref:uracil-DNA glycosylase n=1 Tax=unclassified Prosthecochloris TaxID=2632826 RepID=UPI00223D9B21|nr:MULTISPECIES: uracil-DNA glycosylase [unclassified Prosthecochloris]UZJ39131.1 uracil-DNA glycosylase [Prosthecochloris sp. SCSIO W1102]